MEFNQNINNFNNLTEDWQICFASQRPFPSLNDKLIIGLPLLFLTSITTVSNCILIYYNIFYALKSKTTQQNNQVLILVNHFAAANIGYCIVNFISSIPSILSPSIIYSTTLSQFLTASLNTHFYLTILFMNFLIGFERFIYFFELFSKNTVAIIRKKLPIGIWIFGFLCACGTEISGCHKRFNQWSMTYVFSCTFCGSNGLQVSALYNYWGLYSPIGLISLYVAVFVLIFKNKWKIGISSSSNSNNQLFAKQEIKVAINFFVICCFQWIASTMFFYASSLFGKTSLLTTFVINIAGVFNGLTQPIALILLNKRARKQLWLRFCRSSNTVGTVSVTAPQKISTEQRRIIF